MGQDYRLETTVILSESQLSKLLQDKHVQVRSVTDLTDLKSIVSYLNTFKSDDSVKNFKGSMPSASETAAISRIKMSLIILYCINNGIKVFYMDTGSLVVDKPLPPHILEFKSIGKFKLEHIVKEGIFLAPSEGRLWT